MTNTKHRSPIFLQSKQVVVRPFCKEDLPETWANINNLDVIQYLGTVTPRRFEDQNRWYERSAESDTDIIFSVDSKEGEFLGTMGLHRINHKDGTAGTGAALGRHLGKGYGSAAKILILHWAFTQLNLRKICSEVLGYNLRSQAYLKKTGYKEEGRRVKQVFQNGDYQDLILMAVFREDFMPLWEEWSKHNLVTTDVKDSEKN